LFAAAISGLPRRYLDATTPGSPGHRLPAGHRDALHVDLLLGDATTPVFGHISEELVIGKPPGRVLGNPALGEAA